MRFSSRKTVLWFLYFCSLSERWATRRRQNHGVRFRWLRALHSLVFATARQYNTSINRIFPGCLKHNRRLTTAPSGTSFKDHGPDAHPKSTSFKVFLKTSSSISWSPDDLHLSNCLNLDVSVDRTNSSTVASDILKVFSKIPNGGTSPTSSVPPNSSFMTPWSGYSISAKISCHNNTLFGCKILATCEGKVSILPPTELVL